MTTIEKIVLGIIVVGVIVLIYVGATAECLESHKEMQWQQPPSMVVGQSEYFGGVAMPLGNIKQVEVTVCDKYK